MASTKDRDYKQEYKYHASAKQKKNRAARNKARRKAIKNGTVKKGDDKDIGHVTPLKNGMTKKTKVQARKSNRSHGGKIGSKAGKAAGGRKSRPRATRKGK